ncbi:hypothetical protein LBMAG49_14420 [Planctomycetota bacterium]|nr:hypothetical protein LBMAG49_14420 [Planctomycetota bacterium]
MLPTKKLPLSGGSALATLLHVLVLFVIFGQIVYLASRYRLRFDTTSDSMYSLTESTSQIIGGLDKRLVIEAYLSPKADLPSQLRDTRTVLDNFLDELVQMGKGKVVVQRYNPLDDKAIQQKCERVGIKPIDAQSNTTSALEVRRHWQGLRLVYGGDRQKIIEQIAPTASTLAEAQITPAIKDVITREKKKLGFMEWPSEVTAAGGQPPRGIGWNSVRVMDAIARRYEFQNLKDAEGALIPDEIGILFLFRPKDLSDREKFVLDQFVMRGGTMVVLADVVDYSIGQKRTFSRTPMALDEKGSEWSFREQLLCYGIDLKDQIVADLDNRAFSPLNAIESYGFPTQLGMQSLRSGYPYFFHPQAFDWKQEADRLATRNGQKDVEAAADFKARFRPGIDSDEFLFQSFKKFGRAQCFYWPCWTDLRRGSAGIDLPAGVTGKVMLWSSPMALVEVPPANLDPFSGADVKDRGQKYADFIKKFDERLRSEPRLQAPLMVDLAGNFPSFFAGKPRPKKPSEIKEEEAAKKQAILREEEMEKAAEANPALVKDADKIAQLPDQKDADKITQGPPKQDAEGVTEAAQKDPLPMLAAKAPGRIVVIGDSDFLRDDFVRGEYQQIGGPASLYGALFFGVMLDWLSQDSDLMSLYAHQPIDRKLQLLAVDPGKIEDPRDSEKRLRSKTNVITAINVAIPCGLLCLLGAIVWLIRRAQKRAFLAAIGN